MVVDHRRTLENLEETPETLEDHGNSMHTGWESKPQLQRSDRNMIIKVKQDVLVSVCNH